MLSQCRSLTFVANILGVHDTKRGIPKPSNKNKTWYLTSQLLPSILDMLERLTRIRFLGFTPTLSSQSQPRAQLTAHLLRPIQVKVTTTRRTIKVRNMKAESAELALQRDVTKSVPFLLLSGPLNLMRHSKLSSCLSPQPPKIKSLFSKSFLYQSYGSSHFAPLS